MGSFPYSKLRIIEDVGHVWILDHMKEVLETLVPDLLVVAPFMARLFCISDYFARRATTFAIRGVLVLFVVVPLVHLVSSNYVRQLH
jgi:hypothetical protein